MLIGRQASIACKYGLNIFAKTAERFIDIRFREGRESMAEGFG
jgi:hypothetical protein